ncbi:MAG: guanylate kinase [Bacteroidota bacterium]
MNLKKRKIIVITAPSGAGKTTITQYLMQQFPDLSFSVSATTREKRSNETDGKDYYFISKDDFEKRISENAFLEWEMVYEGTYYGTLTSEIHHIWQQQRVPLLDIDVQGALNVKRLFPEETITIFIAPPSVEVLKERLNKRGTDTQASIEKRISKAADEMKYMQSFDKIIFNNQLEKACKDAGEIISLFLQH